jgi:hypothetical protein
MSIVRIAGPAAVLLGAALGTASAQVVFDDSDFDDGDWTFYELIDTTPLPGAMFSAGHRRP